MTLVSLLMIGFLLGLKHATEADHVAAVATFVTRGNSLTQTVRVGIAWGCGHTVTLLLFGGAVLVLGLGVPHHAAQSLELAVGLMLILLGAGVLLRLYRERFDAHAPDAERFPLSRARFVPARALVVGMVHGMAGSAALILLSLQAVESAAWGLVYIAVFGLGSILGMAALSIAMAVPLHFSARHLGRAHTVLSGGVGAATVVLGLYIVYQTGLVA